VVLRDVEPPVVGVIDVPSAATLPELHDLPQAAIGRTNLTATTSARECAPSGR
jgi:hypothetical protein